MTEQNSMSLEDELKERAHMMCDTFDLVREYFGTLDFIYKKYCRASNNLLLDPLVPYEMLDVVNRELVNLIDKIHDAKIMNCEGPLPITSRCLDVDKLIVDTQKVEMCFAKDNRWGESTKFKKFCKLNKKLIEGVKQMNRFSKSVNSDIELEFRQMLERYKYDYRDALRYYTEDVYSTDEAKTTLKRAFEKHIAVRLWNKNGRRIDAAVHELHIKQAQEQDLLPLIEYMAKYEALSALEKRDSKQVGGGILTAPYADATAIRMDMPNRNTNPTLYAVNGDINLTVNGVETLNNVNMDIHDNKIVK